MLIIPEKVKKEVTTNWNDNIMLRISKVNNYN